MKRFVFLVLIACFLYSGISFGQADFTAKYKEAYARNNVKEQTEWSFDYVNGKPSTQGYISQKLLFDRNGNTLEELNYKKDGTIVSVVTYSYDDKGRRLSFSSYTGNKEKLTYSQNIRYDANGNKLMETGYDGVSHYKNTFIYDTDGKLLEIKYANDNVINEKRTFSYHGNATEMVVTNANNSVLSKVTTSYDSMHNITEEVKVVLNNVTQKADFSYSPTGKRIEETRERFGNFSYRRRYVYDTKGDILKIYQEKPRGKTYVAYEYKYDPSGNVIEERWTKDESSDYSVKKHKYNTKGLLIESDCYFATYKFSELYKYTYTYFD